MLGLVQVTLEQWKSVVEISAFVSACLFFLYKLLAGTYVLGRLTMELSTDADYSDKSLVRITLKLTNQGIATLRPTDAWLKAFALEGEGTPRHKWGESKTERSPGDDRKYAPACLLRGDGSPYHLKFEEFDLERVAVGNRLAGKLDCYQAGSGREWLNLEPGATHFRQFLWRFDPGCYRIEARLVAEPVFAGLLGAFRPLFTSRLFSLGKHSQWVATSVVNIRE